MSAIDKLSSVSTLSDADQFALFSALLGNDARVTAKNLLAYIQASGTLTSYAALTDAATVSLPTVNTALALALAGKQAALVSGANLRTVNGNTLLGSTDIAIPGASDATTLAKGIVQLAGDLAGTAALPTVPGLATKADAAATTASLALKASLAAANNWPLAQTSDLFAVAYAASITLDAATTSNHVNIGTLTGNLTLANPTGFTKAATLNIWLTQDATGSRLLTLGAKIKTAGAAGIVLSTAVNSVDFLSLVYNPTKDIWVASVLKAVA